MDMFQSWPLAPGSAFWERQIKANQLPRGECSQRVYPAQGQGSSQEKLLWATACLTFSWEEELSPLPNKLLPVLYYYYYFSVFKLTKLDGNSRNMDQDQTLSCCWLEPCWIPRQHTFILPRGHWMRRAIENPRSNSLGMTWESVFVCFTVGILTLLNPT